MAVVLRIVVCHKIFLNFFTKELVLLELFEVLGVAVFFIRGISSRSFVDDITILRWNLSNGGNGDSVSPFEFLI